jgi:O-antigen ligase
VSLILPQLQSTFKMLFWPRREDLAVVNRYFLPLIVTMGGILGSGLSSLIVGGMVLGLLQLGRGVADVPRDKPVQRIAFCFASLFAVELLSDIINFNGFETLREIGENLPFLGFLPLYAVITARRGDIRDGIEKAAIVASLIICGFAIVQFQFFSPRALGGAGNAGVFGVMCLLLFAVDFLTLLRHHRSMRALAGFALLAAACALVLSGMRSLWPALVLIPPVMLLIYGPCLHLKISKRFLGVSFILLIAAGIALYQPAHERIVAGFQDFDRLQDKNYTTSLGQRVAIWKAGWALVAEKPWLGQGPGKSMPLLTEITKAMTGTPLYASHYHNSLLTYWVRSGILGVFALMAVFAVPLLQAAKNLSDETSIYGFALLVALELTYMVSGLFGIALGHDILDTVFIGTMAIALYMIFHREPSAPGAAAAKT